MHPHAHAAIFKLHPVCGHGPILAALLATHRGDACAGNHDEPVKTSCFVLRYTGARTRRNSMTAYTIHHSRNCGAERAPHRNPANHMRQVITTLQKGTTV